MVTPRDRGKGDAEPSSAPQRRQRPKRSNDSRLREPPMTRRRVAELREEERLKAKDEEQRSHIVASEPSQDRDRGPAESATSVASFALETKRADEDEVNDDLINLETIDSEAQRRTSDEEEEEKEEEEVEEQEVEQEEEEEEERGEEREVEEQEVEQEQEEQEEEEQEEEEQEEEEQEEEEREVEQEQEEQEEEEQEEEEQEEEEQEEEEQEEQEEEEQEEEEQEEEEQEEEEQEEEEQEEEEQEVEQEQVEQEQEEQEEEEQKEEQQEEEEQEEEEQEEEEQKEEGQEEEEQEEEEDGGVDVEDAAGCSNAEPPSLHRGAGSKVHRRPFRKFSKLRKFRKFRTGPYAPRRAAFRPIKELDDAVRNVGKAPRRSRNVDLSRTPDIDPAAADPTVGFDSIGGLSDQISALKEMVVFPMLYPEVFDNFKIQPPRGCLFYGPPGTGKTLLARALASECGRFSRKVSFFMRKGADCLRKWVGESEQQLRLLFDQAYQNRPSIIFFDEIDGLAPERSSRHDLIHSSVVSTLLALMDGLDSRGEVVVIGATNRLDSIDPALRRPGRFDREFLFGLPDRESRKEILEIHTRPWKPRPSDEFLEELAGKCVGYCGADIRGVCTEAALCALRRRYPQIYGSSQKLLLDCSSIVVGPCDFAAAMRKMLPASRRASPAPAAPLSPVVQPLLGAALRHALEALQRLFPHAEQGLQRKPDRMAGEAEGSISTSCPKSSSFLLSSSSASKQPTSHRPRLLLAGRPASGQTSHLAPALLQALERFPVHSLDSPDLFGSSGTTPEEACAQVFRSARRAPPSVLYVPHVQRWWHAAGRSLRASFLSLLGGVPALAPVLLLATCNVPHDQLDPEIRALFQEEYGEVHSVAVPSREERSDFFRDLVLNQAAEAPPPKRRALTQAMEVLSLAPVSPPRQMSEREHLLEEEVLRKLRLYLRHVTERLAVDRRFKAFSKPVNIQEVADYLLVVQRPMDFSKLQTNIDEQKYFTVGEFVSDAALIWRNALAYNPDRHLTDHRMQHRAFALKDTLLSIISRELDEGFERQCEEIRAARLRRAAPCAAEINPEEAARPGPPRKAHLAANMAAAPEQKQMPVVDRSELRLSRRGRRPPGSDWLCGSAPRRCSSAPALWFQNVLGRAVNKTQDCEVEPLEKLHALLAQCVYRRRSDRDKRQLVQEMEKEIDSFSASGLF